MRGTMNEVVCKGVAAEKEREMLLQYVQPTEAGK